MRKAAVLFLILSVLLLASSCLLLADLADLDGGYDGGYYTDNGIYVEIIPKTAQWITNDSTAVYVTLDANSTTGYEWQASVSGSSIYLDSQYYSAPGYTGALGAGGTWNAKFETTGYDGTSYVTLRYVRPWDLSDVAYTVSFSVSAYYGTITDVSVISY